MDRSHGRLTAGSDDFGPGLGQDSLSMRSAAESAGNLAIIHDVPASSSPAAPRSLLIEIIEGEIIPRLFLTHRDRSPERLRSQACEEADDQKNYELLAGLFLNGDNADIVERLEVLLDQGMQREKMYLGLLASVPRTLGEFWEKGICTFDGMARGLSRLDQVLQEMHLRERASNESP